MCPDHGYGLIVHSQIPILSNEKSCLHQTKVIINKIKKDAPKKQK